MPKRTCDDSSLSSVFIRFLSDISLKGVILALNLL
jgi:hypothetical protein